jgi:hypothetical protein
MPRDRAGRRVEVPARQPVLDCVERSTARGKGAPHAQVKIRQLGRLPIRTQPGAKEVSEQRVQGVRIAGRPHEYPGLLDLRAKSLGQAERALELGIELVGDARVDQAPLQVRLEPIEDLLRQVLEDRLTASPREPLGAGPRRGGKRHTQGPALGGGEQFLDLVSRGLLAAHQPEAFRALRR